MEEIKILFDSVLYAVYISPLIFLLSYIAYLFFVKYKKQTSDFVEEGISSEDEMDIFGLNQLKDEKKFREELEEIKKSINNGEQQIKVEFTKAMYILKNFNDYNFFSSEDNKIIFEKLKTIIDNETQIENVLIDSNMIEKISISDKPFNQTTEILEDGSVKVYNPNGFTIIKDRLIIKTHNYEMEEKKKASDDNKKVNGNNSKVEELEEKIHSMEEQLLNSDEKKAKPKKKKDNKKNLEHEQSTMQLNDEVIVDNEKELKSDIFFDSVSMNEDIENLIGNFIDIQNITNPEKNETQVNLFDDEIIKEEIEEKSEVKISDENYKNSFLKELHTKYEFLEDYNMVFILESFDEKFKERIFELLNWMFESNCLIDRENKFIFCDIDLDNQTLFIDAYLFVYLFSKLYKDNEKFSKVLLHSGEILNSESLKKILSKINLLLSNKYNKEFFKFMGRNKSPFTERVVSYEIDGTKRILSTQMLMINISIEEDFEQYIENAKDVIVSIDTRPNLFKVSMKNKKEIDSFGFDYFKKISLD